MLLAILKAKKDGSAVLLIYFEGGYVAQHFYLEIHEKCLFLNFRAKNKTNSIKLHQENHNTLKLKHVVKLLRKGLVDILVAGSVNYF